MVASGGAGTSGEESLIARIQGGETEIYRQLTQPHEPGIRAIAFSMLCDERDAEDVVQDTLLKGLTHLHQLRDGQRFCAWLSRIAVNEARMRLRKQRNSPCDAFELDEAETEPPSRVPMNLAEWREVPSAILERKEMWAAVNNAMHTLEPIYREVFVLRDLQHLTIAETATALAISEASVMTRLHRARLQLRAQLSPLFGKTRGNWIPLRMMRDMANLFIRRAVGCKTVVGELSNYIDGRLDPHLREEIDKHLKLCRNCSILLDSTRKLLYIVGDQKIFMPPFRSDRMGQEPAPQGTDPAP